MPKRLPLKMLTAGPIAARTRLKLGSPMHKTTRVQYPDSWPLLQQAILFSNLESRSREDATRAANGTSQCDRRDQHQRSEIDIGRRRGLCGKIDNPTLHIEPCKRRSRQKVQVGKKIRGSPVTLVTFRSGKRSFASSASGLKKSNKQRTIRSGSRRARSSAKQRKNRKPSRKSRRNLAKRRRGKRRKSGRSARRRKAARQRRKKKSKTLSSKRRRRNKNMTDISPERKRLEVDGPYGHACDFMLKQKNAISTECFDSGHDEIKDDPLNVNDICRSLVRNLPGVPADCREENFDEKTTRPEHERPARIQYKTKNISDSDKDSEGSDEERNNNRQGKKDDSRKHRVPGKRVCTKDLRFTRHHTHSRSIQTDHDKRQAKYDEQRKKFKRKNDNCSPETERADRSIGKRKGSKPSPDPQSEGGKPGLKNATRESTAMGAKKSSCRPSKGTGDEKDASRKKPASTGEKRAGKMAQRQRDDGKDDEIGNEQRAVKAVAREAHRVSKMRVKNIGRGKRKAAGSSKIKTVLPYHGKPVPQNRRREDIDIIRKQGKRDISLHIKRVSRRQGAQTKNPRVKRQTTKQNKQRQNASAGKHSRKRAARHRPRRSVTGRSCLGLVSSNQKRRRRSTMSSKTSSASSSSGHRKTGVDRDGNGNNNVNNNQTEVGSWGRVGSRLLRIGRYLLRKFQLFLF